MQATLEKIKNIIDIGFNPVSIKSKIITQPHSICYSIKILFFDSNNHCITYEFQSYEIEKYRNIVKSFY